MVKVAKKLRKKLLAGGRLTPADLAALLATSVDGTTRPTPRSTAALGAIVDNAPVVATLRADVFDGTRLKRQCRVPLFAGVRTLTGMCMAEAALWAAIDDPPLAVSKSFSVNFMSEFFAYLYLI